MNVMVSYSITCVDTEDDLIMISLKRLSEAKSPIAEEIPKKPFREEEQIARRMMQASLQAMKQQFQQLSPFNRPKLPLSLEEYEKLGKPTVNDVLTVTFTFEKKVT